MSKFETGMGKSPDQQPKEYFKSISLAFHMNELLLHYGSDRDQGYRDIAWHSVSRNESYLLIRDERNGEKRFTLRILNMDSGDDGNLDELDIIFFPEQGVTAIEGNRPKELVALTGSRQERSNQELDFVEMILKTHES